MAKLYFYYSAMNAGKTTTLLQSAHNYRERGMRVAILTPKLDHRAGSGVVASRIGLTAQGVAFDRDADLELAITNDIAAHGKLDCVLVDEAQFLSEAEIDTLSDLVDFYNIPVICYGLRTDFRNRLFPGSRRLMEIADVIEEVPTVCWCGKRAQCNTRYANGKIVREGAQIMLGSNESYVALCRKHYKEGKLWKEAGAENETSTRRNCKIMEKE